MENSLNSSFCGKIPSSLIPDIENLLSLFDSFEIEEKGLLTCIKEIYEQSDDKEFPDWTSYYDDDQKLDISHLAPELREMLFSDLKEDFEEFNAPRDIHLLSKAIIEKTENIDNLPVNPDESAIFKEALAEGKLNPYLKFYSILIGFLSPALLGKPLKTLLDQAKAGDHKAILKPVQIDKTLIGREWCIREIRKAQILREQEFLDKLSTALKTDPFKSNLQNNKLYLVILFCWNAGLNKLTRYELCDLFEHFKIYNGDADNLAKMINRLGLEMNVKN